MASILCYMTLLLCAVALSEGCSCAEPVPPPDWKGNAYEYWNKQRLCAADYGEILLWNCLVLNLPHWFGRLSTNLVYISQRKSILQKPFFITAIKKPIKKYDVDRIWRFQRVTWHLRTPPFWNLLSNLAAHLRHNTLQTIIFFTSFNDLFEQLRPAQTDILYSYDHL